MLANMRHSWTERPTARGLRIVEEIVKDFRYAARTLINNPGPTLVSAVILALAIGANTLVFTFFNASIPSHFLSRTPTVMWN